MRIKAGWPALIDAVLSLREARGFRFDGDLRRELVRMGEAAQDEGEAVDAISEVLIRVEQTQRRERGLGRSSEAEHYGNISPAEGD